MDIRVTEKSAVVFDLDDTLYPEMDFLRSAYSQLARKLDPDDWKRLYALMFSLFRSRLDVFEIVGKRYGYDKMELLNIYRNHHPNIKLSKGVKKVVKSIKDKNGKFCILTDGRSITQRNKINALGLTDYVDMVIVSEEVGTEKPNEANFKLIMNQFQDHYYYYIGDNQRKDFIAPNKLGWRTVGLVDRGLNMHYDSHNYFGLNYEPNDYIMNFDEFNIL
jgi:putative hydrolase of the HAD superfamily